MSWNYDSLVPPEPAAAAVAVDAAPQPVVAAASPNTMSPEEMQAVRQEIDKYSASPEVQGAVAQMVSANQQNPERLTALVRELMDAIEAVKQNPHAHHPVSPEIAQAVEQVRKVEMEKPDPLNLLRGNDAGKGMSITSLLKPEEPEKEPPLLGIMAFTETTKVHGVTAERMPVTDLGDTTKFLASLGSGGLPTPTVPDVRGQGQGQVRGSGAGRA